VERVIIAAVLVVTALAIAAVLVRRRGVDAPTQPRWSVPTQLDRSDFDGSDRPFLVVVFTSATCESCERATAKARVVESPSVAYIEVTYQDRKDLHDRYTIEAVPCILVTDREGAVRASFIGVPTATDLWAAVAEAREPDLGRPNSPT